MPAYDYHCPQCDLIFEATRPMSRAGEPAPCPNGGTLSPRVFNPGSIQRSQFRGRHPVREDPGPADDGDDDEPA